MKNIILLCDFFGFKPSLQIQGKMRFHSMFTSTLSIFVCLISLLCMGYFGSELITRDTPTIIIATENTGAFGPMTISNKGFLFMMGVEDQNTNYFVDPTVFEISALSRTVHFDALSNGTVQQRLDIKKIKMDLCDKFYTPDDLQEKNFYFPLNMFYCSEPNAAIIEGFWGSPNIYQNVFVEFTKCKNTTENNFHCKSYEEINKIIQNCYISLGFTTFEVNPKNYTNPFKRMFFDDYNLLNANSSLEYSINLFPLKLISDDGLMFQNQNSFNEVLHSMRIFNRITPSDKIVSFMFQGDPTARVYLRNYIRLQTVLTQIGGFIKAVVLLGSMISFLISKNYFFILYLSQIFNDIILPATNMEDKPSCIPRKSKLSFDHPRSFSNAFLNLNSAHESEGFSKIPPSIINSKFKRDLKIPIPNRIEKTKIQHMTHDPNKPNIKFNKALYLVLLDYLFNLICIFKNYHNKSRNFKIVTGVIKIYEKTLSVDNMITNSFELKMLKNEVTKLIENQNMDHNVRLSIADNIVSEANFIK